MSGIIGAAGPTVYDHMLCGVHCTFEEYSKLQSLFSGMPIDKDDVERALASLRKSAESVAESEPATALSVQEGGNHYKDMAIQPVEFIKANNIPFIEGCVIKYVTRHRSKNGAQDIRKAIHFLNLLLEFDYKDSK